MTAPDPADYLTLHDVSRRLGLSKRTIAAAIKAGQFPGERWGQVYRIPVVQYELYKAGSWRKDSTPPTALAFRHHKAS